MALNKQSDSEQVCRNVQAKVKHLHTGWLREIVEVIKTSKKWTKEVRIMDGFKTCGDSLGVVSQPILYQAEFF